MPTQLMFFCAPQKAYMCTESCRALRQRPVGKAPGGGQVRPTLCASCDLHPRVDSLDVPTVTLAAYLQGEKPGVPAAKER